MRKDLLLLVVVAAAFAAVVRRQDRRWHFRSAIEEPPGGVSYTQGKPLILFVGNSFTSVNDLPGTFARLARSLGDAPGVEGFAPGGQTFDGHSKDARLMLRIKGRAWDYVVLQEQSQRPAFAPEQVER